MPHVSNITDAGRRRRLIGGVIWLGVAVLATATLRLSRASGWWYALLIVPFAAAALGYFQARVRTCVVLSALGEREVEGGGKAKLSGQERAHVRKQALGVWARSISVGVICAVLVWLLAARG